MGWPVYCESCGHMHGRYYGRVEDCTRCSCPGGQMDAERDKQIENLFTYHAPDAEDRARYERIRDKAKELAYVIDEACPPSPDRTAAIRKLREAVMTANAAIATQGGNYR